MFSLESVDCYSDAVYSTLREHQSTQAILVDKLVSGKLPKQQFIEQDATINKKKEECRDRMAHIANLLRSF